MPNLGNRIPDNPNCILCSANELKSADSNSNGILCSAKLPIAGIRQLEQHTMFCQRAEKRKTATQTAYYVLRNCRLQGYGNPNSILYSAKKLKSADSNPNGIIFIQMLCAYAVVWYTL